MLHRSNDGDTRGGVRQIERERVEAQAGSEQAERNVAREAELNRRSALRLVREGDLVAEVAVTLIETEGGWTPYLPLEDSYNLDDVRDALRAGDIRRAAKLADRVYRLTPVEA